MKKTLRKSFFSSFRIIILGFAAVILCGTLLLMLPFSTADRNGADLTDALFTATSAVCVTGLITQDTATYWSVFGQTVIILLIQIGGMGVVTVAASTALLSGRKIGLMQRSTMQDAISAMQIGGIVRLTKFILIGTISVELIGALLLSPERDTSYKAIFKKYLRRIFWALLIFALPMTLSESFLENRGESILYTLYDGVTDWLRGHSWAHLWYLYMLIGIYLITPIIKPFAVAANDREICSNKERKENVLI